MLDGDKFYGEKQIRQQVGDHGVGVCVGGSCFIDLMV